MKKPMSTASLLDIVSGVRGIKLTKVAQIDRVIDWLPVRAVIETVYTKGSAPTGRPREGTLGARAAAQRGD